MLAYNEDGAVLYVPIMIMLQSFLLWISELLSDITVNLILALVAIRSVTEGYCDANEFQEKFLGNFASGTFMLLLATAPTMRHDTAGVDVAEDG